MNNCPNCGAVRTGNKCEYCGTLFYDLSEIEIGRKFRLNIKDIINSEVICSNLEINTTTQWERSESWDGECYVVPIRPHTHITLEMYVI